MKNFGVKTYRSNSLEYLCPECEKLTTLSLSKDSEFVADQNEYRNYMLNCAHCPTVFCINMNIPESDYEEFEFEVSGEMPYFEMNARKQIRDLMFEKRADLKKLNSAEKAARRSAKKEEKLKLKHILDRNVQKEKKDKENRAKVKAKQLKESGAKPYVAKTGKDD